MGWLISLVATAVAGISGFLGGFGIAPEIKNCNYAPPASYEYVESAPAETNNDIGLEDGEQVKKTITPNLDQGPIDISPKSLQDKDFEESDGRINALSE